MTSQEEKIIELSKGKILLLTIGALVFVALGICFLTMGIGIERYGKLRIYGIGIASIVFFGLCGIIGFKKLFDKTLGIILNCEGFVDNSSGVSAGFVPWSEVVEIGESDVFSQKFIAILVENPEKYLDRGNLLQKNANRANYKMCGTPINISANSLKIDYDQLKIIFDDYFANYCKNANV